MTSQHPRVGVSTLVRDRRGRILLVQRGKAPFRGTWSLPGGHVEPGERLADAAAREVDEETGIAVSGLRRIDVTEIIADGFHYVLIVYDADGEGEPHAASDAADARWLAAADIDALPMNEGTRALIRRHMDEVAGV
jgi:ADP-ribose pyrophosphatase YjhB (NUDIX family)